MTTYTFRFLSAESRAASLNMAIDEVLMDATADPKALPTLRFYTWSRPAVTVGYFQDVGEAARRLGCREKRQEVVRRPTGGGSVLHGKDLAFSLILKLPHPLLPGDVKDSYLRINQAVIAGLREMDPGLDFADCKTIPLGRGRGGDRVCFETPACYDLLSGSRKVVGSSQRRRNGALLHQSAVFVKGGFADLQARIVAGFEKEWPVTFFRMPLTPAEIRKAEAARRSRYGLPEWRFAAEALDSGDGKKV